MAGNTQLRYKDAMNAIEATLAGHEGPVLPRLPRARAAAVHGRPTTRSCRPCERCGQPTTGRFCAFCRARAQILGERLGSPAIGPTEDRTSRASSRTRSCRPRSTAARVVSVVRSGRARAARRSARSHVPHDAAGRGDLSHAQRHAAARRVCSGRRRASRVETSKGMVLTAFRPRFADFVLKMPRGAQVVYPKDLGPIMIYADIFPGARVLEAGTGFGRAHDRAVPRRRARGSRRLLRAARGASRRKRWRTSRRSSGSSRMAGAARRGCRGGRRAPDDRFDRCVLDLPEPWGPLARCTRCSSRAACCARTCPPTSRSRSSCSRCRATGSSMSRRSRRSAARGTSPSAACVRTTAWSATRAS